MVIHEAICACFSIGSFVERTKVVRYLEVADFFMQFQFWYKVSQA